MLVGSETGSGGGWGGWKGGVLWTMPGDCRCMDGVRTRLFCGAGARDALTLVRMLLWCVGVVMAAFFLVISASMSRYEILGAPLRRTGTVIGAPLWKPTFWIKD